MSSARRRVPALALRFRLQHRVDPWYWHNSPGIYRYLAEITIRDQDDEWRPDLVIASADVVCVDAVECDDFVIDLDWSRELGEMAYVVQTTVMEQDGVSVAPNIRVMFAVAVAVDPHWRGRRLGPSMLMIAARMFGGVQGIFLTPGASHTVRDRDGVWLSFDEPAVGRAAQTKVRQAWKSAGFTRRRGTTYGLDLDDERSMELAKEARDRLASLRFTSDDRDWWVEQRPTR